MRILSLNARNWWRDAKDKYPSYYWKHRMEMMHDMIKQVNPDIICVQELVFPATLYIPKGYYRVGLSISHHIYIRDEYKWRNHKFRIHEEMAEIYAGTQSYCIVNVHSSWKRKIFDKTINKILHWFWASPIMPYHCIACGDFNTPPKNVHGMPTISGGQTFVSFNGKDKGTPYNCVDYFVVGARLHTSQKCKVVTKKYGDGYISDHYPIYMDV